MDNNICSIKDSYTVTQHNDLIHSKHDLSVAEQKLILILASTVQPKDTELTKKTFKAIKLAELLGVSRQNMYKELPKITGSILEKPLHIIDRDTGDYTQLTWLLAAKYEQGEGTVTLQFNPLLKNYLLDMKELFTNFKLNNVLILKSKYALRLYQMLKAHQYQGELIMSIEQFKKELCIEKQKSYESYSNLKKKALITSVNEINEKTDIKVDYTETKKGRSVVAINFKITTKSNKKEDEKKERNEQDLIVMEEMDVIKDSFMSYGVKITDKDAKAIYDKYIDTGSNYLEYISCINEKTRNAVGLVISMMEREVG